MTKDTLDFSGGPDCNLHHSIRWMCPHGHCVFCHTLICCQTKEPKEHGAK